MLYILNTTIVAIKATMIRKKEKLDRMFTQFLKISPQHAYKISKILATLNELTNSEKTWQNITTIGQIKYSNISQKSVAVQY